MPSIKYKDINLQRASMILVGKCNEILDEYREQGFTLTLRQLYYQLVARGVIKNNHRSYKNLGALVSDARLAGYIDWLSIVDRTRGLESRSHWDSPADIMAGTVAGYHEDLWADQPTRIEVWVEKDALAGVIEPVCERLSVPYLSCRGYTSQSEMWGASQRLLRFQHRGQAVVIIHLGDHDPSGIDMTRDITDRLELFMGGCEVRRIALNMDQIKKYRPPPNPVKLTDIRARGYMELYGDDSWELDALDPKTLDALITKEVMKLRDEKAWKKSNAECEKNRKVLAKLAEQC